MNRRFGVWVALIAMGLLWGYRDLPSSYFLRDDFMWLFDSRIQLAHPIEFLTTRPSGYFRPFANIVFGIEHALFGLKPGGYFVINILLHGWSALWLAALVRSFGGSLHFAGAAALVVATMGAAGPGVVWISGLVSVLAVAMVLPALWFYRAYLTAARKRDYWAALVFTVLAVCSRESGVLAGVGILILELGHGGLGLVRRPQFWKRMLPFMLAAAAYVFVQADFLTGSSGRNAPGNPVRFLKNVVISLPAVLRPERWRLWFSLSGGLAVLAGLAAILGFLRGKRGLLLFCGLAGLLVFTFLPTYPLLSKGDEVMANRYRYEACFAAALMVAATFDALAGQAKNARFGLAAGALALFVAAQLRALPSFVQDDARFASYAQATRLFSEGVERQFGDDLRAPQTARVIALVGAPIENPKHLRCQLGVWYDLDFERVTEVEFDLKSPNLKRERAAHIKRETGADEVWVWNDATGLQRGKNPLPAMARNWRRPGRVAKTSKVQVLHLGASR